MTAHPKCYARELNNCSSDISREHYISAGVLKHFEHDGKVMSSGFKFGGGGYGNLLPPGTMKAKILCRSHNSELSPLDTMAIGFFKAMSLLALDFPTAAERAEFSGHDLERWLLKCLLGMHATGHMCQELADGSVPPNPTVDPRVVTLLFTENAWPENWGLYLTGGELAGDGDFIVLPWIEDGILVGSKFKIFHQQFFLMVGDPVELFGGTRAAGQAGTPLASGQMIHRPGAINFHRDGETRSLRFRWSDGKTHQVHNAYHRPGPPGYALAKFSFIRDSLAFHRPSFADLEKRSLEEAKRAWAEYNSESLAIES